MATPDLAPDLWRDLMENEIGLDRYGNYTVPSLARCAKLRLVCTSVREANKILQTPYDARVVYSDAKKAVPIRFSGGMHFGSLHGSLVAFSIVRDRDNGQMFAVTNHYLGCDDAGVLWCEVVRTYSLYRLAELLNGHSPDWGARLPDVHELAYRNTGQSLHGFRAKQPTIFALGNSRGAVTKNQLVAKEYKGSPAAGVGLHYDDCISNQLLEWRRPTPPPPPWGGTVSRAKAEYYKQPGLVLITSRDGEPVKVRALDWCFARVGVIGTVLARHDFHRPVVDVEAGDSEVTISAYADRVHVLGKALGWDCAPEIVKELAGHASLLSHGKAPRAADGVRQPAAPLPPRPAAALAGRHPQARGDGGGGAQAARRGGGGARALPGAGGEAPAGHDQEARAARCGGGGRAGARGGLDGLGQPGRLRRPQEVQAAVLAQRPRLAEQVEQGCHP